jgi:hypothetical protein
LVPLALPCLLYQHQIELPTARMSYSFLRTLQIITYILLKLPHIRPIKFNFTQMALRVHINQEKASTLEVFCPTKA